MASRSETTPLLNHFSWEDLSAIANGLDALDRKSIEQGQGPMFNMVVKMIRETYLSKGERGGRITIDDIHDLDVILSSSTAVISSDTLAIIRRSATPAPSRVPSVRPDGPPLSALPESSRRMPPPPSPAPLPVEAVEPAGEIAQSIEVRDVTARDLSMRPSKYDSSLEGPYADEQAYETFLREGWAKYTEGGKVEFAEYLQIAAMARKSRRH